MVPNIILIGPVGVGKSTQGHLLAERLGRPRHAMDARRWEYYREIGYNEEKARRIQDQEGFLGLYRYWKPFEAHAVERLLAETQGAIIDFGAGHSVFEDDALFARVRRAMRAGGEAVLLLPSPDPDESVSLLRQGKWDGMAGEFDVHTHFVKHHSNHELARFVVYT
ncbi:MAG: shikimate kinase, partial [Verrucomicrobiaceae bacterium]